jgi:hypothetical protein
MSKASRFSRGIPGPPGPPGPRGEPGERGRTGSRGATGKQGRQGQRGVQGIAGERGAMGAAAPSDRKLIVAEVTEHIDKIYKELDIQMRRMAQIQAQLDEVRAKIKHLDELPPVPDRAKAGSSIADA